MSSPSELLRTTLIVAGLVNAGAAGAQPSAFSPPGGHTPSDHVAPGHYACRDTAWEQMKSLGELGSAAGSTSRWTSQFDVLDDASYEYRGTSRRSGTYSFEPATGMITWTSGPYASEPGEQDTITGYNVTRDSDGKPVILLHFQSPSYGDAYEYCAMVTG